MISDIFGNAVRRNSKGYFILKPGLIVIIPVWLNSTERLMLIKHNRRAIANLGWCTTAFSGAVLGDKDE